MVELFRLKLTEVEAWKSYVESSRVKERLVG